MLPSTGLTGRTKMRLLAIAAAAGLGAFLLAGSPLPSEAAEETWQVGLSATYTSGDYGTNTRTDILYMPFSLRRLFRDGDLTLIVPYISVASDGRVTLVGGVPAFARRVQRTPARVTNEGIGDVIMQGRYYILDERTFLPTVALVARLKAPTADADKGLGTGEWDEGIGTEISKKFAEKWTGFFDLGYTIIGQPAGVTLQNRWNYDLGLGYNFTEALMGSVYYEEWRTLVPGQVNPRDLLFAVNYKATSALRLNFAIETGLSNGAPEYGITGGLSWRF